MPKSKLTTRPETRSAIIRRLLERKTGADLAALQLATGWKPHSIRAAMSRLRKAGCAIERRKPAKPGRGAIYGIATRPESRA